MLYRKALEGEPDCGGLVGFNYFSGEPVTGTDLQRHRNLEAGHRPLETDRLLGHGGFFKTPGVGQQILAAAQWRE